MTKLYRFAVIIAAGFILATVQIVAAQETGVPKIRILDKPETNEKIRASGGTYEVTFVVDRDPDNKVGTIYIRADNEIGTYATLLKINPNIEKYEIEVKLFEDDNKITIFTALNGDHPDKGSSDFIFPVICKGSKCTKNGKEGGAKITVGGADEDSDADDTSSNAPEAPPKAGGTGEGTRNQRGSQTGGKASESSGKALSITSPANNAILFQAEKVPVKFKVSEAARGKEKKEEDVADAQKLIKFVNVTVTTNTNKVIDSLENVPVDPEVEGQTVYLSVATGLNTVTVTNADEETKKLEAASVTFKCDGVCGVGLQATGSSLYTRAILGFQQSGVSAGPSTQKPFLDFFFGAPLGNKINGVPPLVSVWGNVRITSLPQQVLAASTAISSFGSNSSLDSLQGTDVNNIVQGFEFLTGVDIRLFPFSRRSQEGFPGLSRNTLEKTSLSLVISGGAINPFTQTSAVQFRGLPRTPTGEIDEVALRQIPGLTAAALAGKDTIALVTPERDRFLRQYYAGLRLKTFYFDRRSNQPINRFPAMIDILFGRNESVTGNLKKNVLRLEGFVPLPIREANFIYLFGTATLKLGGTPRTFLPLTLPATTAPNPSTSDPNVLVVPINRIESLRSTRDFYNFGIGFNLLELFNRKSTTTQSATKQ